MALLKRIVSGILSLIIGVILFKINNTVAPKVLGPLSAPCEKEVKPVLNNAILDRFLCVVVPMFESAIRHPTSIIIFGYLIALFFVLNVFWFVEASRKGASVVISFYGLAVIMIVVQLLGVYATFPLLYIPAYLLVNAGDRSSKALEGKAVSVLRVLAIIFILFVTFTSAISMLFFDGEKGRIAITVFQFVPVVAPLLVIPFAGSTTNKREGYMAVERAYLLAAGACFLWQIMGVLFIVKDPSLITQLIALVVDPTQRVSAAFLLLVDWIGLWIGLLYFSFMEDGVLALLANLVGSILLGPGAFALYFIYREQQLTGKLDEAKKKSA